MGSFSAPSSPHTATNLCKPSHFYLQSTSRTHVCLTTCSTATWVGSSPTWTPVMPPCPLPLPGPVLLTAGDTGPHAFPSAHPLQLLDRCPLCPPGRPCGALLARHTYSPPLGLRPGHSPLTSLLAPSPASLLHVHNWLCCPLSLTAGPMVSLMYPRHLDLHPAQLNFYGQSSNGPNAMKGAA